MKGKELIGYLILALLLTRCSNWTSPASSPPLGTNITHTPLPLTGMSTMPSPSQTFVPPTPSFTTENRTPTSVLDLMYTEGCTLPCWWGIIPGQSVWNDVYPFLSQYDSDIHTTGNVQSVLYAYVRIPIPEEFSKVGEIRINVTVSNGMVSDLAIIEIIGFYDLPSVLSLLGQPNEIYIHTYSSYLGIDPPLDVLLLYKDQGILALYPSSEEDIIDDTIIRGCFSTSPILYLWASGNPKTFREAVDTFGLDYYKWDKPIMPLEEATGMTVETFYETYRDPANDPCIETPRDLWPDP